MSTIDEVTYHRSFLPDYYRYYIDPAIQVPYNPRDPNAPRIARENAQRSQAQKDVVARFGKHPRGLQVFPRNNNQKFVAFQLSNLRLSRVEILMKADQDFETYATPFERTWSDLCPAYAAPFWFRPIVDDNLTVIGHTSYQVPSGAPRPFIVPFDKDGYAALPNRTLDVLSQNGIHIFVTPAVHVYPNLRYFAPADWMSWWGFDGIYPAASHFLVHTLIDGEVIHVEPSGTAGGHLESPGFTPFDLLGVGKIAVYLGAKIGKKVTQSLLMRSKTYREARQFLNGATQDLAKKVQAKMQNLAAAIQARNLFKGLKLGRGYDPRMGIPDEHLRPMIEAAKEANVIAMFRANKAAAIPLIRQGAHGKPKWAQFKTSSETGVLTAKSADEYQLVFKNNHFVVHADQVTRRTARRVTTQNGKDVIEEVPLNGTWKVEAGQVVAKDGKPIVGDYDLLGVAPIKSPGRNISTVPDDVTYGDWTGPDVKKYADAVNKSFDRPRVLHGAQDQYGGTPKYRGLTDDTAYAVFPDGRTYIMEGRKAQETFYEALGRQAKSKEPAPIGKPGWHQEGDRIVREGTK